jgi:16S rRNA A1518/A1519 N6-dimethyltransferase RsmA/KsgA/DIM1 with predicted DNA glycosylase/AP lyase activity
VASTKRAAQPARKKYVPSEEHRAEDNRLKEKPNHPSKDDLREFDRVLEKAFPARQKLIQEAFGQAFKG